MRGIISRLEVSYPVILTNAGSLVSTMVLTSGLGFLYWWFGARNFTPQAVGLASASISAMLFIGNIAILGFGTLLVGELPKYTDQKSSLILSSLVTVGVVGGGLGLVFAAAAPRISDELSFLAASPVNAGLFAVGVSLTTMTSVIDQATVGLLRSELQLVRNALFAGGKLALLILAAAWYPAQTGMTIFATWTAGNLISIAALAGYAVIRGTKIHLELPRRDFFGKMSRVALGHHGINLILQAPSLILPVLVTALLGAEMNAYFYTAWMISGFAHVGTAALTTVLFAAGSAGPEELPAKVRLTLKLCLLIAGLAAIVSIPGANLLLRFFGEEYAVQAGWSLRILILSVFPLIIKNHYVAIKRVHGQIAQILRLLAFGSVIEIGFAGIGAMAGGLAGLSLGWVAATFVEAALMSSPVYSTATKQATLNPGDAIPGSPMAEGE